MSSVEIEVKFHLTDISRMRERLNKLGAVCEIKARETNIRFEDRKHGLYRQKSLLRLRKADKATLTYKSSVAGDTQETGAPDSRPQFKVQNELEVTVDDFSIMRRILEALGFHAEQIYEKDRETWSLGQTHIFLDQMPYGAFIEIEGEPEAIRRISGALDLKWHDRILCNYLEIFNVIRQDQGLPFMDVTFENFNGIHIDMTAYLPKFRAS